MMQCNASMTVFYQKLYLYISQTEKEYSSLYSKNHKAYIENFKEKKLFVKEDGFLNEFLM